jgi:hypothetical protein
MDEVIMTETEMDADLEDARSYLGCTRLTVDRCRHASVHVTSLWIFDGKRQIASATRLDTPYVRNDRHVRWRCCTMHQGSVANGVYVETLLDALGHIMRCTKETV